MEENRIEKIKKAQRWGIAEQAFTSFNS